MGDVVLGAVHVAELDAQDRLARSKPLAERKLRRFLDSVSVPVLLATHHLVTTLDVDPDTTGLFTISAWDPDVPAPPFEIDTSPASHERLSRYWFEGMSPTDWLRGMSNSPLCHTAIALGLRGANAHVVGDSTGLAPTLQVASAMTGMWKDPVNIVVAYDFASGDTHGVPDDDSCAIATAVALGPGHSGVTLASLVAAVTLSEAPGKLPETTLREVLSTIGVPADLIATGVPAAAAIN